MFRSWRRIFPKFIDRIGCPTPDTGKICKMCKIHWHWQVSIQTDREIFNLQVTEDQLASTRKRQFDITWKFFCDDEKNRNSRRVK